MNTKKYIDPIQSFTHLPSQIASRLRKKLSVRKYQAGENIFLQGDSPKSVFLIANGRVKIVRVTPEGYESILCVRGPGDYFCPVPLLDGGDQLGSAVAMTDTTLYSIERGEFSKLCRESPQLLTLVQGDCLAEVRHLLNRLEAFAFRSVRERVAIALLHESRTVNKTVDASREIKLTQNELAGLVGAARESVSRVLKSLEREGIIILSRGKVKIVKKVELEEITGGR